MSTTPISDKALLAFAADLKMESDKHIGNHKAKHANFENNAKKVQDILSLNDDTKLELAFELTKKLHDKRKVNFINEIYVRAINQKDLVIADKACEVLGVFIPFETLEMFFKHYLLQEDEVGLIKTSRLFNDIDRIMILAKYLDITDAKNVELIKLVHQTTVPEKGMGQQKKRR